MRVTHAPTVAILGTRYPDFRIEESILRPFGASLVSGDGRSRDAIAEQAAGATVVLAGSGPRFDAGTIDRLTCIGIVRYGVGVETIDVEAAARAGMWVANVPDYGTHAVALHCVSLMLAALRRLPQADHIVKSHRWGFAELRPLQAPESLTVGIVGFGRIGQRVAEMLHPFGFNLIAFDAHLNPTSVRPELRSVTFEELITTSDIVTLHAPGNADGSALHGRARDRTNETSFHPREYRSRFAGRPGCARGGAHARSSGIRSTRRLPGGTSRPALRRCRGQGAPNASHGLVHGGVGT